MTLSYIDMRQFHVGVGLLKIQVMSLQFHRGAGHYKETDMDELSNAGRRRMLASTGGIVALAGLGGIARADTGAADPGAATGSAAKPLPPYASWKDADSLIVHSANTIETKRTAFGSSVITPTNRLFVRNNVTPPTDPAMVKEP